jgi:hypothetical protein
MSKKNPTPTTVNVPKEPKTKLTAEEKKAVLAYLSRVKRPRNEAVKKLIDGKGAHAVAYAAWVGEVQKVAGVTPGEVATFIDTSEKVKKAPKAKAKAKTKKTEAEVPALNDKMATRGLGKLTVEQLQARYEELCGRPTDSDNPAYLQQRIRTFVRVLRDGGSLEMKTRTRVGADGPAKPRSFPVTPAQKEALEAFAEKQGCSSAHFIRRAIGEYMERNGAKSLGNLFLGA